MLFKHPSWAGSFAPAQFLRSSPNKVTVARSVQIALITVLFLGAVLRLSMAWHDLKILDTLFFPDDTYLSLGVARNIALGYGSTFDREMLTNGYQPLYVWLMVPVYRLFPNDLVTPIHIALTLLALVGTATGWFVYRIVQRLTTSWYALIACAIWMFDPHVFSQSLNGLETGIVLLGIAATTDWYLSRIHPHDNLSLRNMLVLGLLIGVTILARVDQTFLLAAIGLDRFLKRRNWSTCRQIVLVSLIALLINLPWLIFGWSIGTGPLPESGAAVRFQAIEKIRHMPAQIPDMVVQDIAIVLMTPYPIFFIVFGEVSYALIERLRKQPTLQLEASFQRLRPLRFGLFYCIMLFFSYLIFIPARWFFPRYDHPIAIFALIAVVSWLAGLPRMGRLGQRVLISGLLAVVLLEFILTLRFLVIQPTPNGYLGAAQWVNEHLAGQVVGSYQSGAIGYWSSDPTKVINLDGVVDRHALQARRERRVAAFLQQRRVAWVVDWEMMINVPTDGDLGILQRQQSIPSVRSWNLPWYLYKVKSTNP